MRRTFAVAATALVLPFTLSACGEAAENAAEKAAEKAIEDGASGDVDVDFEDGEVKIENSDGTITSGNDLPDGFPEDDVPVVGEVQYGAASDVDGSQGWTLSTQADGSAADAFDEAKAELEGAGFTSENLAAGSYAGFRSDQYQVVLTASDNPGGGAVLTYIVAPAE